MYFQINSVYFHNKQRKTLTLTHMIIQDVDHRRVRYSQFSIKPCFSDGQTSVLTWIDALPHSVPLEVMNIDGEAYVSLDNKKLYSAKNYSPNQSVKCVVYNAQDPVTSLMEDHGLDLLTVIWCSGNELHRLSLRAKTIEAVFIIRCASQTQIFHFMAVTTLLMSAIRGFIAILQRR